MSSHASARVELAGISDEMRKNVEANLSLSAENCGAPEWKIRRLFAESDEDIRTALEVFGYYDVRLTKDLDFIDDCWTARFNIDPGPVVIVKQVSVRIEGPGETDERFRALLDKNPLSVGQPLDHRIYDGYKKRFAELAQQRGYFDARFLTSRIRVLPAQLAAEITLIYESGERYRFGPVEIEQDVVDPELVRRYIKFQPGMPYDANLLSTLYESLLLSNYFNAIDIRTVPRPEFDRDVLITVRATAGKVHVYGGGIGFGTNTGLKLRASYNNRRLNRSGHQAGATMSLSSVISEAGLKYRIPLANPSAESLNFDTGYKYEDTDTFTSRQAIFAVKRLKLRGPKWLETEFIDVAYEDYAVGTDLGTSFLLIPGISWSQAISSGPPRPTRGHKLNLQVSGTSEILGSTVGFFRGELSGKLIRRLWPAARLLMRAEAGSTVVNDIINLPASRRYFTGGDFSVRGYGYQTLGPTDLAGNVIGGKHLLTGSIELDQKIAQRWSVAAFLDGGNAFNRFDDIDLQFGVGGGVRWYSPLGPIRVDLAFPLSDEARDSYRIHITMGPDI